ncbi:MAG TPA: mucoidy inhibitor MuiA family protein, partial [Burkholderiales bacterium]
MHRNQELRRLTLPAAVGAALVVISSAAYAQDASKITAVTLYPGSATVERTARVTPGMTRLEISGLPANFDPQTLRVDADPGVRVGEVSAQDTARTATPNAREAQLEEKIQALKDHQTALDAEVKSAEMVNSFLSRLSAPGSEKAPMPDAKSLASIVDLIRKGGGDSLTRIRRAQAQKREIAKQIAALERDLARLKSGTKDTRTVIVGVFAERPGYARVSYQVAGAGWRPAYRADLDSQASKLELVRQASVSQTTGEDWAGVKLKLSTGQPRLSPQGPDPRPWLVSIPVPRADARAFSGALNFAAAEAPAALKRELRDQTEQAPIETQTSFATEFEVPGEVSLPSDGRKVTVSLARLTLPVKMRLRVVP